MPSERRRTEVSKTVEVPPHFESFAERGDEWRAWLDALPRLVDAVLGDWRLTVDGAAMTGQCALVVPVRTPDDEPAVVKFGWPHWEAEHEHLALRMWGGNGAVRLLRADPGRHVMVLERANPGVDLTRIPVLDACESIALLYPRLHVPAHPELRLLSVQARRWARELSELPADVPIPRRYVDQALTLATDFACDPDTDGRLIHTDLHYFNVLAAERQPWLAIDPKPLSGDPHYEVAPLLWNRWDEIESSGDVRKAIRERFHTVVDVAGLDEARARDWVTARMVINAMWTVHDLREPGRAAGARLTEEDREWITLCITVTKAVQD